MSALLEAGRIAIGDTEALLKLHDSESLLVEIEREAPLTVNRVQVRFFGHLYRWADGSWRFCPEWASGEYSLRSQYGSPYVTRAEQFGGDANRAQTIKASELVQEAVKEWASTEEARPLLAEAGRKSREAEIEKREAEIEEARKTIRLLKAEQRALRAGGSIRYRINDYQSGYRDMSTHVVTRAGRYLDSPKEARTV